MHIRRITPNFFCQFGYVIHLGNRNRVCQFGYVIHLGNRNCVCTRKFREIGIPPRMRMSERSAAAVSFQVAGTNNLSNVLTKVGTDSVQTSQVPGVGVKRP
eukprot:1484829-Rhodomonas_salina.1